MVATCCVTGCKNRQKVGNGINFYRIPMRPPSRRELWTQAVNRVVKNDKGVLIQWTPAKSHRVCSDHFDTGRPQNDPSHPDYIPHVNMRVTRHSAARRKEERKKEKQKIEDAQKRKEAASALLFMTKASRGPKVNNKESQTCSDPGDALIVMRAKLNHLEKEIEVLQKINTDLRMQKQKYQAQLTFVTRRMESVLEESKKRKMNDGAGDDTKEAIVRGDNLLFKDFSLKRVLREDPRNKIITLHGSLSTGAHESADAVVLLERKPFDSSILEESLHKTRTTETLKNDIYSTHDAFSPGLSADLKATVICPATEKHVSKYSDHEPFVVRETPELYRSVTEPCMAQSKFSIQWVYNILKKKTEADRIVVEDPDPDLGFVLLPDMKWDRKSVDQLYLVAIVHRHGIRSLRDLTTEHLPLLENIRSKGLDAISQNYGVPAHQMRVYLHYQPSYYHLHVHFTTLRLDSPPGSDTLRAHLLDDVIDNIHSDPNYYSKKTISYVVRDGDELYKWYKDAGHFGEPTPSSVSISGDSVITVEVVQADEIPTHTLDLEETLQFDSDLAEALDFDLTE